MYDHAVTSVAHSLFHPLLSLSLSLSLTHTHTTLTQSKSGRYEFTKSEIKIRSTVHEKEKKVTHEAESEKLSAVYSQPRGNSSPASAFPITVSWSLGFYVRSTAHGLLLTNKNRYKPFLVHPTVLQSDQQAQYKHKCSTGKFVSWRFEPSQRQRITSGRNTHFSVSPSYTGSLTTNTTGMQIMFSAQGTWISESVVPQFGQNRNRTKEADESHGYS